MPHVATALTHQGRPYYGWREAAPGGPGLGAWYDPVLNALGAPFGAIFGGASAGQAGAKLTQTAKITEPPPTVTPAAPQTYGPLTIPGAWTPEEMFGQTTRQQQSANTAYSAGSRMGLDAGNFDDDTSDTDTTLMVLFVLGVVVIGGVMVASGKRR